MMACVFDITGFRLSESGFCSWGFVELRVDDFGLSMVVGSMRRWVVDSRLGRFKFIGFEFGRVLGVEDSGLGIGGE